MAKHRLDSNTPEAVTIDDLRVDAYQPQQRGAVWQNTQALLFMFALFVFVTLLAFAVCSVPLPHLEAF